MGNLVCAGALLRCSFGLTPSSMVVLPVNGGLASGRPYATVQDHKPLLNILPFGMCTSLSNPAVATATSVAAGVLTPMPCLPATSAPWIPGSLTVLVNNKPALNDSSKLLCNWGGIIQPNNPGQVTVQVP